ncbi:MAG: RNA polymerase sigma factor RpoD/SigA [Bacteroidales bacterium]|nr:RNA polymerase sigma factor RpoD/SigA [Bacteroidales bacterium]
MRQLRITKQITQRDGESINRYFAEINQYPMISAEEEVELAQRIKTGDDQALERLVVANLRFVVSVAKQYQNQGLSFPDLINEGNLGLVRAASRFDETRGFKFISYAVWWIRQSIAQAISDQTRVVRLPLNRIASMKKITRAIPYLEQELEREPTETEIADYLDLSDDEVKTANHFKMRQVSFDSPLSQDGDSDFSLYDVIESGVIPAPDDLLIDESVNTNIGRALKKLPTREAGILIMSFGLFGSSSHTLADISKHYNMSTERVRQVRAESLRRLRKLLNNSAYFSE